MESDLKVAGQRDGAPADPSEIVNVIVDLLAHELRTPLTAISLALQSAQRFEAPAQVLDRLAVAHASLQNALRLIADMTLDAALHTGQAPITLSECDLVALAQGIITTFRVSAPQRTITLLAEAPRILVIADADRTRQVMENLLVNAIRYGVSDTAIVVRVYPGGSANGVAVTNAGSAIPPVQLQRIWERFYHWERFYRALERRTGVGLGLGLALARSLVERQKGRIGVVSAPEQGTTFWFTLPAVESAETLDARNSADDLCPLR